MLSELNTNVSNCFKYSLAAQNKVSLHVVTIVTVLAELSSLVIINSLFIRQAAGGSVIVISSSIALAITL